MSGDGSAPPTLRGEAGGSAAVGPLGVLPRLAGRRVRLDRHLGFGGPDPATWFGGWEELLGVPVVADRFEVHWRAAGLKRPGAVVHLTWPRHRTRLAVGLDPPLAHGLVDRLLGFERTEAEAKLQVSPVEWGVLAFLAAEALRRLEAHPGPLGPWDLTIDRVGPDPFDVAGLGPVVTWRWRVQVGATVGSLRLWLPESLLSRWLDGLDASDRPASAADRPGIAIGAFGDLVSEWRAEAGAVVLAADSLGQTLAAGRLLLIDGNPLSGTVASPEGEIRLVQDGRAARRWFATRVEPGSAGDRLIVQSLAQTQATTRKPSMSASNGQSPAIDPVAERPAGSGIAPLPALGDLAVTLTVELGRVNLPIARLAELRPGDVVELGRLPGDSVDLTSNGRLVARGELVQVDTELAVRVTHVFL